MLLDQHRLLVTISKIANTLDSIAIRRRSAGTSASDRYLIDVDPSVIAIWETWINCSIPPIFLRNKFWKYSDWKSWQQFYCKLSHLMDFDGHHAKIIIMSTFSGTGPWFNIKMASFQHRKSHCGDKTILRPSYLHNGITYTGKTTSLYWIGAQLIFPFWHWYV